MVMDSCQQVQVVQVLPKLFMLQVITLHLTDSLLKLQVTGLSASNMVYMSAGHVRQNIPSDC